MSVASRLAAHPRFHWAHGMLLCHPENQTFRITDIRDGLLICGDEDDEDYFLNLRDVPYDWTPDLADDATAGCILAMLPGVQTITKAGHSNGKLWRVRIAGPEPLSRYADTLGEACALALLDCWGPP